MKTQSDHELSRLEAVGNGSYLYRWDIHSEKQEQPSEDGEGVTGLKNGVISSALTEALHEYFRTVTVR